MKRPAIEWDESLAIGEETIDAQHKGLIEMVAAIPTCCDEADLGEVISRVEEYVTNHFAYEEALMERVGYPDAEKQRRSHKKLAIILSRYSRDYAQGERDVFQFKHFMISWIRGHVMVEDMKIGEFLSSTTGE